MLQRFKKSKKPQNGKKSLEQVQVGASERESTEIGKLSKLYGRNI